MAFRISSSTPSALRVYLIGGGNLALRGLKSATKDIDIVVPNRKQFFPSATPFGNPSPKVSGVLKAVQFKMGV